MDGLKEQSLPEVDETQGRAIELAPIEHIKEHSLFDDSSFKWAAVKGPAGFAVDETGVYSISASSDNRQRVSSPIWVKAITVDRLEGTYGLVVRWVDRDNNIREHAFPMDAMYENGTGFIQYLALSGVRVFHGQTSKLKSYLTGFEDLVKIQSVSKLGWMDLPNNQLVYVLPQQVVERVDKKQKIIFQPEQHSHTSSSLYPQGELKDWVSNVASKCYGNPYLIFGLALGFAGPLLRFTGVESGGFNLYGRSSGGKTTFLQIAASVFGDGSAPSGNAENSVIQTWNSTGNALEGLASASNDNLLSLDEIHTCADNDFSKTIYDLTSGKGKNRMNQDANLKKSRAWRILIASTGEKSAREKILETSKRAHSGLALRIIDIPTDEGLISDSGDLSPADYCDELKASCTNYFGTAGPAFIKELINRFHSYSVAKTEISRRFEEIYKEIKLPNLEQEQERALKKFALVATAGLLASEFKGLIPLSRETIIQAIKKIISHWLSDEANLPVRVKSAIAIREYIQTNRSRFVSASANEREIPHNLAGYMIYAPNGKNLFLFLDEAFNEASNELSSKSVAQDLKDLGFLYTPEGGRLKAKHTIAVSGEQRRPRMFSVYSNVIDFDETTFCSGTNGTSGTNSVNTKAVACPATIK